jgi:glycosyltransferase involved in cell wall biosynthesis
MRVQAFGSFDAARHPRVGVLVEGLREHGVTVDVCNAPFGLSTAERVRMLQQPWRLPLLVLRILRSWLALARTARALPKPDAVLVGYLGHFDVHLARLVHRGVPVVHDMLIFAGDTAADRGAGGVKQRLLRGLDRAAVRASDLTVVDTAEHQAMLPAGARSVVVPVGAPLSWLAPAPEAREGRLRVVFFGLYTPLQGAPVIGEALALLGGQVDVTRVGGGQDLAETKRLAGDAPVDWRDWVEPADLPALVREHDVCLGVFSPSGKGMRVVPNKVYQGASAGCALVTSDSAPQRRVLGDAAVFVPPGDPRALADALLELDKDRTRLLSLRTAAHDLAADAFTPSAVARPLLDALSEIPT